MNTPIDLGRIERDAVVKVARQLLDQVAGSTLGRDRTQLLAEHAMLGVTEEADEPAGK